MRPAAGFNQKVVLFQCDGCSIFRDAWQVNVNLIGVAIARYFIVGPQEFLLAGIVGVGGRFGYGGAHGVTSFAKIK